MDLKGALKFKKLTLPELRMLRMVCGSPVMAPNFHAQRLLQPNIFERVFLVPVDIDHFRIDTSATDQTTFGNLKLKGIIELEVEHGTDWIMNLDHRDGQESFILDQFIVQIKLLTGN